MSRIIQSPDPGPGLGQSQNSGQDIGPYLPDVTAVRGANSIEQIATITLNLLTQIQVIIDGNLQFWVLQSGPATGDTENTVAPLDNPTAVHWQRVGGFGPEMMAAARVTTVASVSTSNNSPTTISFDTSRFNSGEWSSGTNPSRITAITDGIYSISGSVSFSPNATGQRKLSIRKSAANDIASEQITNASSSLPTNITVSTIAMLSAGEYVELVALQTSGGSLDILKTDQYSPEFAAVRLAPFPSVGGISSGTTTSDTTPSGVPDTKKDFSITDIGWYRVWSGNYPNSGSFNIKRSANGDGQTSDTVVDFTIIADSPEGIINVSRNAIPMAVSPSIDAIRVSHDSGAELAYVDVHLLRSGDWSLQYSSADESFLDAPFLTDDDVSGLTASLAYTLKSNVTGGTGKIDVPQIDSSGNKLVGPPANTWAAPTGTAHRTTFNADAPPTLTEVAQHLKAVVDDLVAAGIFVLGPASSMTYAAMIEQAASLISEGSVSNVTNVFNITAAPDTTVQGLYVAVGTFNSHTNYRMQGYEYETGSTRCVRWSTEHSTWTILNASGNTYYSAATEATPYGVVQWKNEAASNVTVTITSPNIAFTYNVLTDTHTAMVLTDTGSSTGYAGLYLRGSDLNTKRRYYLAGTGTNNKRIEWDGVSAWKIKDDSGTLASSTAAVTYPDQTIWLPVHMVSVNAVDLMAGVTIAGDATYSGTYVPVQGVYNVLGTHKLVYRRDDGLYFLAADDSTPKWAITNASYTVLASSDTALGAFPWNVPWTAIMLTAQENKIASPGFVNTYSYTSSGNWHL